MNDDVSLHTDMITDLRVAVAYLRIVGAVYPIAPEKAIKAIERVIGTLSAQLETLQKELKP